MRARRKPRWTSPQPADRHELSRRSGRLPTNGPGQAGAVVAHPGGLRHQHLLGCAWRGRTPQTERGNEPRSPPDAHPAQGQCRRPPDRRQPAADLHRRAADRARRPRGGCRPGGPADRRSRLVHSRGHRRRGRRRSRRRSKPAGSWSSGPRPPRWTGPMGSSPTPTATCGRSFTTRSTSWGPTGGPRSRRRVSTQALRRPRCARGGDVGSGLIRWR
jgi:hypothetical protein